MSSIYLALLLGISIQASAQNTPEEPKYVSKDGLQWSGVLKDATGEPLRVTNGCTLPGCANSSPKIDETSQAFLACKDLGYALPTWQQFQDLAKEFDHLDTQFGVLVTDSGADEFGKAFETDRYTFWTSSVVETHELPNVYEMANVFTFPMNYDIMVASQRPDRPTAPANHYFTVSRDEKLYVICVRGPMM